MTRNILLLLVFLFVFVCISTAQSQHKKLIVNEINTSSNSIILHAQVYIESSDQILNLPNFLNQNSTSGQQDFIPINKIPGNCWVRCIIENTDSVTLTMMFHPGNNQLDTIRLYQRLNNALRLKYQIGYKLPFSSRPIQSGAFYLPVTVPANSTKEIIIQFVNNDKRATTSLELLSEGKAFLTQGNRNLTVAFYIGIIFFAFLYNLLLYFTTRNMLYFNYCLYVFFTSCYMIYDEGFIFQYILCNSPDINENLYYIASLLATAFSINFIVAFISQEKKAGVIEKMLWTTMFLIISFALWVAIVRPLQIEFICEDHLQFALYVTIAIASFLLSIYIVVECIKRNKYALFYSIASLGLVVGVVFLLLNFFHFIDNKAMRINLLYIGIIAEIIILTIYFAWNFNNLQSEKKELKQELIEKENRMYLQLIAVQEFERKRIAQDLHDGVLGFIGALRLYINSLIHQYKQQPSAIEISNNLGQIQEKLDVAIRDIRDISHNLMPKDFESTTLYQLLENHFYDLNKHGKVHFKFIGDSQINMIPQHICINVYRIAVELAANIVRHSQASEATIQCICYEHHLLLQVEDDGKGFDVNFSANGIGLKNIQSRVEFLNGKINIDSNEFATTFIIEIPTKVE